MYLRTALKLVVVAVAIVLLLSATIGIGVPSIDAASSAAKSTLVGWLSDEPPTPDHELADGRKDQNINQTSAIQTDSSAGAASTQPVTETAHREISSGLNVSQTELLVHERINEVRQDRGLQRLAFDTRLADIAQYHSNDMAENGYLSHMSPADETMIDRYEQFGYDCRVQTGGNRYATGAENILYTYYRANVELANGSTVRFDSERELASGIVAQWMGSDGHRENILKPYWDSEGIGIAVVDTRYGLRVYATQNFC